MKKFLDFRKSKLLLFMLFAMIAGASPAWADSYTTGFESTDGWPNIGAMGGDDSKWSSQGSYVSDYELSTTYKYQGSKGLYNAQTNSDSYFITPKLAAGTISFWAAGKKESGGSNNYVKVFKCTDNGDGTFTIASENLSTHSNYNYSGNDYLRCNKSSLTYTEYSFSLDSDSHLAFLISRAGIDNFTASNGLASDAVEGYALIVKDGSTTIESPYAFNFGLVSAGATHTFTLSNTGTAAVEGLSVSETGNFGATLSATSIAAGEETTLTITMPAATSNSTITISSTIEGIENFVINVSGTIRDESKFYESGFSSLPDGWNTTGSWSYSEANGAYTTSWYLSSNARLITPKLTIAEGESFFVEAKGYSTSNTSYQHLQLQYSADGTNFVNFGTEPTLDPSNWNTFMFTGCPAGSYYIAINASQADIRMFYGGALAFEPELTVSQSDIDFGAITENTSSEAITVTNTGKAALTGLDIALSGAGASNFSIVDKSTDATTIEPGESMTFKVQMAAVGEGIFNATVTISADGFTGEDAKTFNVSGVLVKSGTSTEEFATEIPSRWDNGGWTVSNGAAVCSGTKTMSTSRVNMTTDDFLVIKVRSDYSTGTLTVKGSKDGGEETTFKTINNTNDGIYGNTYKSVVVPITTAIDKLIFTGYYANIDEIAGIVYDDNDPAIKVTKTAADGTEVANNGVYDFAVCTNEATEKFYVANSGTGTLHVTNVTATGGYTVSATSADITTTPFELTVTQPYDVNDDGAKSGVLTITTTELGDFTITLSGFVRNPAKFFTDFSDGTLGQWTSVQTGSSSYYQWVANSSDGGYVGMQASSSYYQAALTSPKLAFSANEKVSFEVARYGSSYTPSLKVEFSTNGTDWAEEGLDAVTIENENIINGTWTAQSITVPSASVKYIRFNGYYCYLRRIYGGSTPVEPKNLAVSKHADTATLTWETDGEETAWQVYIDTDENAINGDVTPTEVSEKSNTFTGLALKTTYYAWVRSKFATDSFSDWVETSFSLTYSTPAPTSVDGDGITNVTFGTGTEIVNYDTAKSPYYQDNTAQVGGVTKGSDASVDITFNTGYAYGTIIWVDWNQNYEFEGNEVVYVGECGNAKPSVLNAIFTVPAEQAVGNYCMRIAAADSYYNDFITSIEAAAAANPTPTSTYTVVQDYTLKVNDAVDYAMSVGGTDVSEGTIAFGTVKNTTTTKTFTISNDGTNALTAVSVVSSDAEVFTVSETDFDLAGGESKVITVTFVKAVAGDYSKTITISQANVTTPIVLTATATYVVPTPATMALTLNDLTIGEIVEFGTVGKAKSKTFTVTNSGEATLNITSIESSNTTDFTVTPATLEVAGGETGEFTVTFVWDGEALNAEKTATITVTSSNEGLEPVSFSVTGTRDNLWMADFEGENPLEGWENSGFTVKATAGSSNNIALTSNFAVSAYTSSFSTLTTPLLMANAGDKLTFDAFFLFGDDPLKVEYSTDGVNFNEENPLLSFTGSPKYAAQSYASFEIEAPITGDFYLRFSTKYGNAIDNIEGFKLAPAREHDAVIVSSSIPSYAYQYREYTASVTVQEKAGKDDEVVTAELWVNGEKVATESGITLTASDNTQITLKFTPHEDMTAVEAYIKVYNDNLDLTSDVQTLNVYAAAILDEEDGTVTTGTKNSMVVKYTAKTGWNTICMPFNMTDEFMTELFGAGYKVYQFQSYEDDVITFAPATTLESRTPYLVYAVDAPENAEGVKLLYSININYPANNPSSVSKNGVTFQGTYAPVAAGSMTDTWYGVTNGGEIRKAGSGASLKGFRAYFTGVTELADARIAVVDESTGITTIIAARELNNDKVYNLNGQRVENAKKGLYIVNGRKVVVK